jgi:hypothetical protein
VLDDLTVGLTLLLVAAVSRRLVNTPMNGKPPIHEVKIQRVCIGSISHGERPKSVQPFVLDNATSSDLC